MSATNSDLGKSSVQGMVSLSYKTVLVNIFRVASLLVLTKFLDPRDYGIFGIINGFISVAAFFTDIGMGGALIQQSDEPNKNQLKTFFGMQLFLSCLLTLSISAAAPMICDYYQLEFKEVFMVRILSLILPLTVLSNIPKMFLQRWLQFGKLAKVEVAESATVSTVQIVLAILGFGVWSFIIGGLARAMVGFILSYKFTKKFYFPNLKWSVIKPILSFGVPFQFNSIIPVLRGIIMPAVLKIFFTVESMGLIFWTLSVTSLPNEIATIYNQVSFSALSKLQKTKDQMSQLASRGMEIMLLVMGFIFGLGAAVGVAIITLLFAAKWSSVKPFLPLAVLGVSLIAIRHLTTSLMNASSRPGVRLVIESLAVVIEIPILWFFAPLFGLNGYFYSLILVGLLAVVASFYSVKEFLTIYVARRFFAILVASLGGFGITIFLEVQENLIKSVGVFTICFLILSLLLDAKVAKDYLIIFKKIRKNDQRI